MRRFGWVVTVAMGLVAIQAWAGENDWTHLGRDTSRQSTAVEGPMTLDANTPGWTAQIDPQDPGRDITFEGATGPVVYAGKVFAYATCGGDPNSQIAAWDTAAGRLLWSTRIDAALWGSYSTPVIDTRHNTVLIGSGSRVFALDANDGNLVWKVPTELSAPVINASLCIAADIPHARAFITDYDGFGTAGRLYCINLDAAEPNNPFAPGQIVWDVLLGTTSGNSPSYTAGMVYVTTANGRILAYDANALLAPDPIWDTSAPDRITGQFMSGITVSSDGYLYAASYDWNQATGENNSTLVKVNRPDGRIVWTVRAERTNTTPVVVGDTIFLSGGLAGFGSKPKLQAFRDLGDQAQLLWDTSADLPESVVSLAGVIGGGSTQPAYASGKLYVGGASPNHDYFGAYDKLYILDITRLPTEEGFVLDWVDGVGNSPAVTGSSVYSVGPNALMRFCQPDAVR